MKTFRVLGTIAVFTAGVWGQQPTILRVEGNVYVNDRPVERPNELLPPARSYELWQERGSPIGSRDVDWYRSEYELRERYSKTRSAA